MVEEASLPHVVRIMAHLPHPVPFQLCTNVVPNGPESRVCASSDSEHGLPKFPQLDITGNKVSALVLRQRRCKVAERRSVAPIGVPGVDEP
eukprot:14853456-Alexandrium_andersonii.AAC.1